MPRRGEQRGPWLVCDDGYGERACLYSEESMERLRSDPPRCVRHGSILHWAHFLEGLTRKEARAKLDEGAR